MKVKKSGDWRREIHGDLTVMNAEEVMGLTKLCSLVCTRFVLFCDGYVTYHLISKPLLTYWKASKFYGWCLGEELCLQTLLWLFKCAYHRNKGPFVSTTNEALVGTLMTIGEVIDIFHFANVEFWPRGQKPRKQTGSFGSEKENAKFGGYFIILKYFFDFGVMNIEKK